MTVPKVATLQRGGSRFYVHPTTRGKVPGVTSVVGMLPKEFLKFWSAKLVAETAVENLGALVTLAMKDPVGAVDYLKRAPQRTTGKAADVGSEVHGLVEALSKGEPVGKLHPDLAPFVQGWREWYEMFAPEFLFVEETVWSDTYGYAGSFDVAARIAGATLDRLYPKKAPHTDETVIVDYKTTRSGVHAEVALQLSAYAHADHVIRADGEEVPLPAFTGGAVLHLRPEGWRFVPVRIDEAVFSVFKTLIPILDWERDLSKSVLGADLAGRKFDV